MQKKRILAALLSAAMVITSAAVPVLAEDGEIDNSIKFWLNGSITRYSQVKHGEDTTDWQYPSVREGVEPRDLGIKTVAECLKFLSDGELIKPWEWKWDDVYEGVKYTLDPEKAAYEIHLRCPTPADMTYVPGVNEIIDKKVIVTADGTEVDTLKSENPDALVIYNKESLTFVNHSNFIPYMANLARGSHHHKLTFAKGLEIRGGAKVNVEYDIISSSNIVSSDLTLVFNGDLDITDGGELILDGQQTSSAWKNYSDFDMFSHCTVLEFNNASSMNIEEGSTLKMAGSKIEGKDHTDTPVIKNNGSIELLQEDTISHEDDTSSVITSNSTAAPAVECSEGSSITITGGSTVESGGDTAVKLEQGAKLNTSDDPEKAVTAGADGLTMNNYGDLAGSVSMGDGDFSLDNLIVDDSNGTIEGKLDVNEIIDIVQADMEENPDAKVYALHVDSLPEPPEDTNGVITQAEDQIVEYADIYIGRDGEKVEIPDGKSVTVTLRVGDAAPGTDVEVYHYKTGEPDGTWDKITTEKVQDGVVTFKAKSFSPYACVYTRRTAPIDNATTAISVDLVKTDVPNVYSIMLKADMNKMINGFMSSEFDFDLISDDDMSYEIVGGEKMNVIRKDDDENHYEIHADGADHYPTNQEINIGQVIFHGYGTAKFKITDGVVHTEKIADNIVDTFEYNDGEGNLSIDDDLAKTGKDINISVETKTVTVNVMFPNKLAEPPVNMDMVVTAKGGTMDGATAYTDTKELSKDATLVDFDYMKKAPAADGDTVNANGYQLEFEVPVPAGTGNRVTFTFSGKGYRTYSVDALIESDDENPTVTVWNNVMDTPTFVVNTDKDRVIVKTFLAGDIVEDNTINLYDLSAVVAYFGKGGSAEDISGYVQYDLNRDGKIDSKDIAMVLVSWGK